MKSGVVKVTAQPVETSRWQRKFESHIKQKNVQRMIHEVYAEMTNRRYTPYKEGGLVGSTKVTDKYISWGNGKVPYAHYLYQGEVYGPNIPIGRKPNPYKEGWKAGDVTAWYSPKGMTKYPTGRPLIYNRTHNKLAQHHWDLAVARNDMLSYKRNVTIWMKKIAQEEGW